MFDFFKNKKKTNLDAMHKAMQAPDFQNKLCDVAKKTLDLNTEELPFVEELISQLETCKSIYEYPTLMHNVVLLGRAKRAEMIPMLELLLASVKKEIISSKNEELKDNYKYVVQTLRLVKKKDTHPHIIYYDLSMFLTSFYSYLSTLCRVPNANESKYLHSIYTTMLSIMHRTKKEKEETIEKCKQIVKDLALNSDLGKSK